MGIRKPELSMPGMELLGDIGQCAFSSKGWWVLGHSPCPSIKYPWCGSAPGILIMLLGWNSYNCLQFTLTVAIPVSLGPFFILTRVVYHPFFLRSITQNKSFGHQFTYTLLLPVYKHSMDFSFLDLTLIPCLTHLKNHLFSLHSPYFARLFFVHPLPLSMASLLPSGFWVFETHFITWIYHSKLSHIPLILLLHSLGFPVFPEMLLLSPFPVSFPWSLQEAAGGERPPAWSRETWNVVGEPLGEWAVLNFSQSPFLPM